VGSGVPSVGKKVGGGVGGGVGGPVGGGVGGPVGGGVGNSVGRSVGSNVGFSVGTKVVTPGVGLCVGRPGNGVGANVLLVPAWAATGRVVTKKVAAARRIFMVAECLVGLCTVCV